MSDRCPKCGGDAADNYFDRSLCFCEPGGVMHTCCVQCGFALDGCSFDEPESQPNPPKGCGLSGNQPTRRQR